MSDDSPQAIYRLAGNRWTWLGASFACFVLAVRTFENRLLSGVFIVAGLVFFVVTHKVGEVDSHA